MQTTNRQDKLTYLDFQSNNLRERSGKVPLIVAGPRVPAGETRYSLYGDGSEELYNHADDPFEWANLAFDPQTAAEHRELMDRLEAHLPEDFYTLEPR